MVSKAQIECKHLHLKKCITGELFFYKCDRALGGCGMNFRTPDPLVIEVVYPEGKS
jgi:hypothetical protein